MLPMWIAIIRYMGCLSITLIMKFDSDCKPKTLTAYKVVSKSSEINTNNVTVTQLQYSSKSMMVI